MNKVNQYGWLGGKFYIKPANTFQWKHLSEFPMLEEMERSINNQRAIELAESTGSFTGFSEGYCLHQLWLNDPNYQLTKIPG